MIQDIFVFEAAGFDPYENLATEKHLMDRVLPGQCILYLWQNQNTVVIGRNQNAWLECRTTVLEGEGGHLARRLSGGGAVFHDLGNLNFTFLVRKEDYDLDKQLEVIQQAALLAGIQAERSGRNDLLADGKKFSGNAFFQNKTHAYHHGTILIDVDSDKLSRYLSPPKAKLAAKGVTSVRSRVVNLRELAPALTVDAMKRYMKAAFCMVYDAVPGEVALTEEDRQSIRCLADLYGSWEYRYGTPLPFTFSCEDKFPWGFVQLQLQAKNGTVEAAKVYTDAMDWNLSAEVETALTGCRFTLAELQQALRSNLQDAAVADDLCALLEKQSL